MPTPDLDAVVAAGRRAIADAPDLEALREAEQAHLARRSALGEVQRSLGGLDEAARRDLGRRVNQARTTLQAELAARRAELEAERDQALLEAERVDVTLARPGAAPRGGPPDHPDHRRDRRHLHRPRLPGRRGARGRDRLVQLPGPQHPPRPPGPLHAGQPLPRVGERARGGRAGAAHPDLAGADPHHAGRAAAGVHRRPGPLLPGRHPRRHPPAGVQPGRDPGRRPRPHHGRHEGHAARLRPGLLRRGAPDPPAPLLLPVRRARGRGRRLLLHLRRHRRGLPHLPRRGLDRAARGRHGPPQRAPGRRLRPRRGLRLRRRDSASSGPSCSAPAWPTCAP